MLATSKYRYLKVYLGFSCNLHHFLNVIEKYKREKLELGHYTVSTLLVDKSYHDEIPSKM